MRKLPMRWLWTLVLGAAAVAAVAREAPPLAADPALEAHMMAIAEELRCLVCQNETLAASQADLAQDLRKQIRLKLQQGQSDREIFDFMTARYGDFVLYRPPWKPTTLLLWLGPFALLAGGAYALFRQLRQRSAALAGRSTLSDDDTARARRLLADEGPGA